VDDTTKDASPNNVIIRIDSSTVDRSYFSSAPHILEDNDSTRKGRAGPLHLERAEADRSHVVLTRGAERVVAENNLKQPVRDSDNFR